MKINYLQKIKTTPLLLALFLSFSLFSCDKADEPSLPEPPDEPVQEEQVIRVLAIGNSFSEDAVEQYLYELGEAEGVTFQIGNLYIGGASLDIHLTNANNDAAAYEYRKIDLDGTKSNTPETTLLYAISDEDWDYISLQQVSNYSGLIETFENVLPLLKDYIGEHATNPEVKYILHQTWAYAVDASHPGFANYDHDQETMYNAITNAYREAGDTFDFDLVIPAGTAIQNGRASRIGDNFTRDGYHLDLHIGRYTAAATWFEALTEIPAVGNLFSPEELSPTEVEIAQNAAHFAVLQPDEVTEMENYRQVENPVFK